MNKLSEALSNFVSSVSHTCLEEFCHCLHFNLETASLYVHTSFRGQGLEKETFSHLDGSRPRELLVIQGMVGRVKSLLFFYFFDSLWTVFSFRDKFWTLTHFPQDILYFLVCLPLDRSRDYVLIIYISLSELQGSLLIWSSSKDGWMNWQMSKMMVWREYNLPIDKVHS